jgi:hypothetical protein
MTGLSLRELEAELIAELPARRALSVLTTGSGSGSSSQDENHQGTQQAGTTTNKVTQIAISVFGDASNTSTISTTNLFSGLNVPINVRGVGN